LVEFVGEVDVAGAHTCCHVGKDCQWEGLGSLGRIDYTLG
jgi:hypothetical protein